jgi:C-terminal processing protease CtpA/Prc
MQQEKRAVVIGDRSAGLVMRGKTYWHQFGQNLLVYYGMEVTDADVVNPDGKSLEHVGVTPDEVMLPTADDLAAGRDPVLAHAAKLAGLSLTPEKAGTLFPVEWRK